MAIGRVMEKILWPQGTSVDDHLKTTEHDFHYGKTQRHQDKAWKEQRKKEGSYQNGWDERWGVRLIPISSFS